MGANPLLSRNHVANESDQGNEGSEKWIRTVRRRCIQCSGRATGIETERGEGCHRRIVCSRCGGSEEEREIQDRCLSESEVKVKPATPARKGVNPFTKEPCVFKAKPASK